MEKKIKVCTIVLTCDKYNDRLEKLKENFLNNFKYDFLYLKCDTSQNKTYQKENTIYSNCEEIYENLPKKVLLAYEYLYHNTDYDYIIKIDDDTIINNTILKEFIDKKFYNLDYIGFCVNAGNTMNRKWHFGKCKDPVLNKTIYSKEIIGSWCGGGYGYVLSRNAISKLLEKNNYKNIYNELYEDKAVGDALRLSGIKPSYEILPDLKITCNIRKTFRDKFLFNSSH